MTPTPRPESNSRPIELVLARLRGVRRSGSGWTAHFPHHDDTHPSLSIREGADGRVLLHCHAGCPTENVVVSAGLAWVDLFPPGSHERKRPRVWMGAVPMGAHGRPALESLGDSVASAMLGELARLAQLRGTLDSGLVSAMRVVAAAVGVSAEQLAEAARAALAGESPA